MGEKKARRKRDGEIERGKLGNSGGRRERRKRNLEEKREIDEEI